jgi:PspAB-like protein
VKFLDSILGRTKPKRANLDALFAVPGAAITLEASMGLTSAGAAAVCFKPASAYDFASTTNEIQELLELQAKDTGSEISQHQDSYGYHWIIVRDPDMSDLVTSVHMVNSTLAERGFDNQLLASVFAFRSEDGGVVYLVYLFKRGSFYPFAPAPGGGERRDNQKELQLQAALGHEVPLEADLTRWFPIWGAPVP